MNRRFLVFILIILGALSLDAQNIIRPKVECPNGIYVNSYNGVLFYQRPDVSLNNRSLRLEAVFYYNSSSNRTNYGYGNGWSLGHELRFVNDSLGVIIEQGDGRRDLFTRYGSGFEAPAGVFSTLSVEGDGYLLTYKDGTKYYFTDTVHKQLTQLKDRYDNTLDFGYEDGRLTSITDISGRSLYFTWTDSLMTGLHTSFDDRTWSYRYDDRGNLTCVTDPMGYSVYYGYNDDNRIKTFTDAEGYSTHISYNVDGMAHRIKTDLTDKAIRYEQAKGQTIFIDYLKDARNQYTKYLWDDKGRLVEIENVNMHTSTKFAYDDDNNMVRREDANGHAYTFTYDQNGNMLSSTDPLGYTEYYTYESKFNNITSYKDKNANVFTFDYDEKGNVIESHGPLNYGFQYSYNSFGQIETFVDANGNQTLYDYDSFGNIHYVTDAMGSELSYGYMNSWLLNSINYPNSGVINLNYDLKGRMTTITDQLNQTITYQYDSRNNVISICDRLNNTTNYQYDAVGHIVKIKNALGAQIEIAYNANGYPVEYIDAMGNRTSYKYNDRNQLIMLENALGDQTRYIRDNVGNVSEIRYATGKIVQYDYDQMNRVTAVSDGFGMISSYAYDSNGNLIQSNDAEGYSLSFDYNELNRIVKRTNLLGGSDYYSYDNNGNIITVLDRNNHAITYTYDARNKLVACIDEMNHETKFDYDEMGRVVMITDANGNETSFQYDLVGNRSKVSFANGTDKSFWYDANGNIVKEQDAKGNQFFFSYDAINRLLSCSYPDNSKDLYSYDMNGHLISAINNDAVVSFSYDAIGRLIQETLNGKQTLYSYDIANRKISMTYPSGKIVERQYDLRLRLSDVYEDGVLAAAFSYNNDNTFSQRTYGNGVVIDYSYNTLRKLASIEDNSGILSYQMTYDNMGNTKTRKDLLVPENSRLYSFDSNNQLIACYTGVMDANGQISNPTNSLQYVFDAVGNRTSVMNNGVAYNYTCDNSNAYTSISGGDNYSMQYDANGNMLFDGVHSLQYNYNNQLESVNNGAVASYKYDALSRRVQKKVVKNGVETIVDYFYSNQQVIEERNGNDQIKASYIYGTWVDEVLQMNRDGNTYYYHPDGSNSIAAISDGLGNLVERYDYDPYGEVKIFNTNNQEIFESTCGNSYMFAGRNYDSEIGLYYFRARSLNASIGRFLQTDPLLFVDGTNLYSFVQNRPIDWIDPMGTESISLNEPEYPTYGAGYNNNPFKPCDNLGRDYNYAGLNLEFCAAFGLGACVDLEIGWIYKGEGASVFPVINFGGEIGAGIGLSAEAGISLDEVDGRADARDRSIAWTAEIEGGVSAGPAGLGGDLAIEKGRRQVEGYRVNGHHNYYGEKYIEKTADIEVDSGPIGMTYDVIENQIDPGLSVGVAAKAMAGVRFSWGF